MFVDNLYQVEDPLGEYQSRGAAVTLHPSCLGSGLALALGMNPSLQLGGEGGVAEPWGRRT